MIRIGLIAYRLDRNYTGIGRYTVELARALSRQQGVDVVLLTAGTAVPFSNDTSVDKIPLPLCRRYPALVTIANGLIPLVARRHGLDILHDPNGLAPFLLSTGRFKTVVTLHDVAPWALPGHSTRLDTLVYLRWLPHIARRVSAITTVSESSKSDIQRYLRVPSNRIHVIHPGVSHDFQPASTHEIESVRSRYALPENYLLFVGSIEKRKNLPVLVDACRYLWTSGMRQPLVVVGPNDLTDPDSATAIQDLKGDRRLILTGYVPEQHLPALYTGADVFIFPSKYEGFGLPVLEAMACGTAVVCSYSTSLPAGIRDCVVNVEVSSAPILAEAIRMVLNDSLLREDLRHRGMQRARLFSWTATGEKTLDVYRQIIDN